MINPKVSVIIPVYGAEAFLPDCIVSLRAQTLRDIELIFICDGSPDHSLAILRKAETLDSRIRVIAFEENQGVSAARNAGLDAARGDYIGFCDGDDWAEPEMVETLYRAAEDNRADISFCRVFKDRGDKHENVPLGFDDGTVFDREAIGRTRLHAAQPVSARGHWQSPLPPGYSICGRSALYRHLHEGRGPRRRGGQGVLSLPLSHRERDEAFQLSRAGKL